MRSTGEKERSALNVVKFVTFEAKPLTNLSPFAGIAL